MLRLFPGVAIAMAAGAMLLGAAGRAAAQTPATTTTTTSTTTTTLLPHPFSPATKACVHQANATLRSCRRGGGGIACFTPFETAFGNCFAPGAGVKCATKCATTEASCFTKLPTTRANCRKACGTSLKNDTAACKLIAHGDTIWAGGDGSCITTAQGNFALCRAVCMGLNADCVTAFTFCTANCPNL